jgi:hypothetical protein
MTAAVPPNTVDWSREGVAVMPIVAVGVLFVDEDVDGESVDDDDDMVLGIL